MHGTGKGLGPDVDLNDESAANVTIVHGVIKWFDENKGYGFIIPGNGMADVLLHVTCLQRDGYKRALEGARVVCEVFALKEGLRALRIISMDESTAAVVPSVSPRPSRSSANVKHVFGPTSAMVKFFNKERGFGFLVIPDESDIFVHQETLRRRGINTLSQDEVIWVSYGLNEADPQRRLVAIDVLERQPMAG